MQGGASYIKDTTDFQDKQDTILVTADAVGLYPNTTQ